MKVKEVYYYNYIVAQALSAQVYVHTMLPTDLMLAVHPSSSSQVLSFVDNHLLYWQRRSMPSEWPVLHYSPGAQTGDTLRRPPQLHLQSAFLMMLESRLYALAVLDRVWH